MAAKSKKLKLLVDLYDQLQPDSNGNISRESLTVTRHKGDLFEPVNDAEYERLTSTEIALDPEEAQKAEAEELRARQAQLEAQQEALAAELESVEGEADRVESGKAPDDGLDDQKVDELRTTARAEGVEHADDLRKAELIDAIRAKRES